MSLLPRFSSDQKPIESSFSAIGSISLVTMRVACKD